MIKKYPWNEPDRKKRRWNDSYCNRQQLEIIYKGRSSNTNYGNIDDLDPRLYNDMQMMIVSAGRGTGTYYTNVDKLDPELYNWFMFEIISEKDNGLTGSSMSFLEDRREKTIQTIQTIKKHNPEWLI